MSKTMSFQYLFFAHIFLDQKRHIQFLLSSATVFFHTEVISHQTRLPEITHEFDFYRLWGETRFRIRE